MREEKKAKHTDQILKISFNKKNDNLDDNNINNIHNIVIIMTYTITIRMI